MKIAKSSSHVYLGYQDGRHKILDTKRDSIEAVREAKYVDISTDIVVLLTSDGGIVPTYASQRKKQPSEIQAVVNALAAKSAG